MESASVQEKQCAACCMTINVDCARYLDWQMTRTEKTRQDSTISDSCNFRTLLNVECWVLTVEIVLTRANERLLVLFTVKWVRVVCPVQVISPAVPLPPVINTSYTPLNLFDNPQYLFAWLSYPKMPQIKQILPNALVEGKFANPLTMWLLIALIALLAPNNHKGS